MGVVSSLAFAVRNTEKCISQGDSTRGEVAACQAVNVIDSVSNVLNNADGAIESIFEKFGKSETLNNIMESTGANSKIGGIAQKAVNPLLCVAAGARILKDDDQYAALIEESTAMGAMFGCESLMKYARSALTNQTQATSGLAGKVASLAESSSTVKSLSKKASEWFTKLGTSTNGSAKQTLVKIGVDALFVCGSILAYNLGHKLGETLSHRNEKESST
ncbi:MAG: hypothetical protein Q4F80_01950 [bacterium]|nr:hypothetical protein [bacterium]